MAGQWMKKVYSRGWAGSCRFYAIDRGDYSTPLNEPKTSFEQDTDPASPEEGSLLCL